MAPTADVTALLLAWNRGDEDARSALVTAVYDELRRMAARRLRHERSGHSLAATALVHETYLKLVNQTRVRWQNRAQFFALASHLMRRVLVDHARARQASKRGSGRSAVLVDDSALIVRTPAAESGPGGVDILALDAALERLKEIGPRHSALVELRFFGGLSVDETAEALNVSRATITRDWAFARAWLAASCAAPLDERRTPCVTSRSALRGGARASVGRACQVRRRGLRRRCGAPERSERTAGGTRGGRRVSTESGDAIQPRRSRATAARLDTRHDARRVSHHVATAAPAGWLRCTPRATHVSTAAWRSRCSRRARNSPRRAASDSRGRRWRFPVCHTRISGTLHDIGRARVSEADGELSYLIMERVDGETLADLLTRAPLPVSRAVQFAEEIAEVAHLRARRGHRPPRPEAAEHHGDEVGHQAPRLRPRNCFLRWRRRSCRHAVGSDASGHPGGHRAVHGARTGSGARGGAHVPISSAWAWCSYEMVAGRRAFSRPTTVETLHAILHDEPPPRARVDPCRAEEHRVALPREGPQPAFPDRAGCRLRPARVRPVARTRT